MGWRRRIGAAALVLAAAAALVACTASEEVVAATQDTATVRVGETLVVDFGEINSSVGDGWVIVSEPDPAVLAPGEEASTYLGEEGSVGGANAFSYRFEAVGAGSTVIEFEYRFRGEVPEDPDEQQSARIEVTVEPR